MRHEPTRRENNRIIFEAVDKTAGYLLLAALLVIVGGSLLWWWPGTAMEYFAPWQRERWEHTDVIVYAMTLATVGGLLVVIGGYFSDRERRHRLEFDLGRSICAIREWWRGLQLDLQIPLDRFAKLQVHRPVGQTDVWQLGIVLTNGSYWRLDRKKNRADLDEQADQLRELLGDDGSAPNRPVESPDRVNVSGGDGRWQARWQHRERTLTLGLMLAAAVVFSLAVVAPVLLAFQGDYQWLVTAVAAGTVLFGVPLFAPWSPRVSWPFWVGWFAVAVAAVAALGAHWAYFPLATAGLAIFANSAAAVVEALRRPRQHTLRIDAQGRIYEDGQLVEDDGQVVVVDELEGAISNVAEERPPTMTLVFEGGKAANRARHLNQKLPEDVTLKEPVKLEMEGLSLFELAVVALLVDEQISGGK